MFWKGTLNSEGIMIRKIFLTLCMCFFLQPTGLLANEYKEVPFFKDLIAAGELPSIAERLPEKPYVVTYKNLQTVGKYGGQLQTLMPRIKDIRLMYTYGYARLVNYNRNFEIVAGIVEKFDVVDGKEFTFYLRKGHKWSDGHPFTTEDFRYYWEDIAQEKQIYKNGPPALMLVEGEAPEVKVIDEYTISYKWDKPNPVFLDSLASAIPQMLYMPAHYLKQFHKKYVNQDVLTKMAKDAGKKNWAALHNSKDNLNRFDNPDLPTLQPWRVRTKAPSERFIFERNPYYYRVDSEGQQLPYIDKVAITITNKKLIAPKAATGESDLQARGLGFKDFSLLKQKEKQGDYLVYFWKTGVGSRLALFPNLNVNDPEWKKIIRNPRFREALSLSINREEINQTLFYGLGQIGNNSLVPQSPLYLEHCFSNCADYVPEWANKNLDDIGLVRKEDGWRYLPDGRRAEIIVETSGQVPEEIDILQLVKESWKKIGIKLYTKTSQKDVFRNRIYSGETIMSVWSGVDNGLATPEMPPTEFVPVKQDQLQWPKWGQYYETKGRVGEIVDMPEAQKLLDLYEKWFEVKTRNEKENIWHEIMSIYSKNLFTIGTVSGIPQPILVSNKLRNVPKDAIYNWHPGAHFGLYRPDTFWFEQE